MIYIENEKFRLGAIKTGAELRSFTDKRISYEHMWQGGPIWNGCSPLLFPIVGKLKNDTYTLNGAPYTMAKHGFARKMDFELESQTQESVTFLLTDNDVTKESYPFSFELRVTFALTENGFTMTHLVKNKGSDTMYFSIGAHPGFRCELGDRILMDLPETASAYRLNESFLRGAETEPIFANSHELLITKDIFNNDALIFDDLKSGSCTLERSDGHHVHVDFGGAPCLGIWARPGAPYVCIEPWFGIDDAWNAGGEIAEKHRICSLDAGQEFAFTVTVTV